MRAPGVCPTPGCPNYQPCPTHTGQRRYRPPGYDARWRHTAKAWLRKHPSCAACHAPAAMVDHIDGNGPLGPRGYDPTNFMSLCRPCHSRKTAARDGGFGNPRKSA